MIGGLLARLRGRGAVPPVDTDGWTVWAIGDVHGRHDLLARHLDRIEAALARGGTDRVAVVTLGDHVDRGPDSAAVVAALRALPARLRVETAALRGNHEAMMLDFLDDPAGAGRRWLRHGGLATAASFGVAGPDPDASPEALERAARALRRALPPGAEAWLRGLPEIWRRGTLVCAHAGLDPARAPGDQGPGTALWGHRDFARRPRADGLWVAHGHRIVAAPSAAAGRIALDVGAYRTGRLAAARIGPAPGAIAFHEA